MKWKLLIMICLLILLFSTGCNNTKKTNTKELNIINSNIEDVKTGDSKKLTLNILKDLARKGDNLSWEDFKIYDGNKIGSGLYIMEYPVDDKYVVQVVGGNPDSKPWHILLTVKDKIATEKCIDIRYDDINRYVNPVKLQRLTLDKVKELSKKGDELSRKDFENYECIDIGSGLLIMEYPIDYKYDDKYVVMIGSHGFNEEPIYFLLARKDNAGGHEKGIDIRYEDIDKYVNSEN